MKKSITFLTVFTVLLVAFLSFSSCKNKQVNMPISQNNLTENRNGEIVWVDLITKDATKSQQFFSDLLGWKFKDHGIYKLATNKNKPVCGIVEDAKIVAKTNSAYWVTSTAISDIEKTTSVIKNNGGKVLSKPIDINQRGKTTLALDPQGALFAILETPNGAPKASKPENNEWIWAELWTNNITESVDFYQKAFNITTRKTKNYHILKGNKYEYGAITQIPVKGEKTIWIPVLKVKSVAETLEKAKQLGGKSIIKPTKISSNILALISTPDGAPFLIQQINEAL